MTIIYLTRHSIPEKIKDLNNTLKQNKEIKLSEEGKKKAKEFFKKDEFKNIKRVYTSDYTRTKETGKILNEITIDNRLGERIPGIPDTSLTPAEYYYKQIQNKKFKFKNGESREEIEKRMNDAIEEIINNNKNEEILVVTHGASMTFLLMKFCNIEMTNIEKKIRKIKFKNKIIFENKFDFLETFKLTFDEKNEIVDIVNVGGIYGNI